MSSTSRSHSHSRSRNHSREPCHRCSGNVPPPSAKHLTVTPPSDHRSRSLQRHTPNRPPSHRSQSAPSPQTPTSPPIITQSHSQNPTPVSSPPPGVPPKNRNMMMYNPYMGMMGGGGGFPGMGMGGGGFPGMGMMGGGNPMMGPMPHAGGTPGVPSGPSALAADGSLQPFDSSQMKRGRMGHYGYLEGRELAGPPVGRLPAGMSPMYNGQQASSQPMGSPTGAGSGSGTAPSSAGYYPQTAQSGYMQGAASGYPPTAAGSGSGRSGPKTSWGDPNMAPRARYDGTSAGKEIVQADVDSPYPLTARGGVASAFTKYGADREATSGIDGRLGWAHRRMREGKV